MKSITGKIEALSQQSVRLNATADSIGLFTDGGEGKWHVARRFKLGGVGT